MDIDRKDKKAEKDNHSNLEENKLNDDNKNIKYLDVENQQKILYLLIKIILLYQYKNHREKIMLKTI